MLTRFHRFHGYGSLRRAYSGGQTVRGQFINLRFLARPGNKPYRVGVVVSRKVHKSAAIRNRIRRRIYECVRNSEHIPPATDIIFTVFSDQVANIEAKQLSSIINELLSKVTAHQKNA